MRGFPGAGLLALALLGGCTSLSRSYDGYAADEVWSAAVTVAREPQYDDWKVVANDVWVNDAERRIEVYRDARRVLYRPEARPRRETQAWRFTITMPGTEPPRVKFLSRGFGIPAHARIEARRFFDDVRDVLAGLPHEMTRWEADDDSLLDALGADGDDSTE